MPDYIVFQRWPVVPPGPEETGTVETEQDPPLQAPFMSVQASICSAATPDDAIAITASAFPAGGNLEAVDLATANAYEVTTKVTTKSLGRSSRAK